MRKKSFSSKDVAKEAGVSQATVSYVLNNVQGIKIKSETKAAVLAAAKKLDYHPNLIARSMRLKNSMSIGIVSDKNISNFMFMKVLEGIKDALVPKNYSITLCFNKSQEIENSEHIKYFNSNRIDGIIFVYASLDEDHIAYLVKSGIPFVIINNNARREMVHLVKNEMDEALIQAILRFQALGSKEVVYFGSGVGNHEDRKYKGFLNALEKCNIPRQEELFLKLPGNDEPFEDLLNKYFEESCCFLRAILCESTNVAFKVLRFAALKGIKIPDQIRIIAIGTSKFSPFSYPALSAIEAPLYEMGFKGSEMLLDIMDGSIAEDILVLEWFFVPRESS